MLYAFGVPVIMLRIANGREMGSGAR
jgi:hypothetical protein